MKRNLNNADINRIIRRVITESDYSTEIRAGSGFNENTELIDDVINRLKEHGDDYKRALNRLNMEFPTEKYRRLPLLKRGDVQLPPNVKVKSTYPGDRD